MQEIIGLLPLLVLGGGILLAIVGIAIRRSLVFAYVFTLVVILAAVVLAIVRFPAAPQPIADLFVIDSFGYFYLILILLATLAVAVFGHFSLRNFYLEKRREEFFVLLMLAALGACMLALSVHFISFFVSLGLMSISLYSLIAYYRNREIAIEAGIKYLILAAVATSFLLFGMALVLMATGTMSFTALAGATVSNFDFLLTAGFALILVGIGFELAAVPFHIWTPDIYEGASAPISAFVASVAKGSVVALLIRFFIMANLYRFENVVWAVAILAMLSMLVGNLLALMQKNVKRLLAYSSVAHFGYLLVAIIAGGKLGASAATFYLAIYMVSILSAFGLVALISESHDEAFDIQDYRGLFWRKPWLAVAFTISLLSLAGIPLTAGFAGKFFVLAAGVGQAQWLLVIILIAGSVIGLYYYLRIIVIMLQGAVEGRSETVKNKTATSVFAGGLALVVLTLAIIWLGTYPTWLMDIINSLS